MRRRRAPSGQPPGAPSDSQPSDQQPAADPTTRRGQRFRSDRQRVSLVERRVSPALRVSFVLCSLLGGVVGAVLLSNTSERGDGATWPVDWFVLAQLGVGALHGLGWATCFTQVALWSSPEAFLGVPEEQQVPVVPATGLSLGARAALYLGAQAAGVAVALTGRLRVGDSLFAFLGTPGLHAVGWLAGMLVGLLLVMPVAMLFRLLTWRPDGRRERSSRRAGIVVALLLLDVGPMAGATVLAYDSPYDGRRLPDLAVLVGHVRPGVVVHSEPLLWVARVLTALLVVLLVSLVLTRFAGRAEPP